MTNKEMNNVLGIAVKELRLIANRIDDASGSPRWAEPEHNKLSILVWQLEKKLAAL